MVEKAIEGKIRVLGLESWWHEELTPEDRDAVEQSYGPDQGEIEGSLSWTTQSRISFLTNVADWLKGEGTRFTAYKFIAKADNIWPDDAPAIDRHFALSVMCKVFYRWRDVDKFALEAAIDACRRSVLMHQEALVAFKQPAHILPWGSGLPGHYCFKQLAIIEEKRGNFEDALKLCDEAKQAGWTDDWDKRVVRLRKKLAKDKKS
ncbi:hypothetical protein [Yoonia sp. MH D7]